jgi:hypothetical protein
MFVHVKIDPPAPDHVAQGLRTLTLLIANADEQPVHALQAISQALHALHIARADALYAKPSDPVADAIRELTSVMMHELEQVQDRIFSLACAAEASANGCPFAASAD